MFLTRRLEEIKPYVMDLVDPGSSLEQLLARNTRVVTGAGTRMHLSLLISFLFSLVLGVFFSPPE
jgi:tetrahydromethanopterin S-methyltransferase subunit F